MARNPNEVFQIDEPTSMEIARDGGHDLGGCEYFDMHGVNKVFIGKLFQLQVY